MDLYLHGSDFSVLEIIENYETLVWTERYQAAGDFRLDMRETAYLRGNARFYRYLTTSESNRPMAIERIERPVQRVNKSLLQIRGKGVSSFLKLRSNKNHLNRDTPEVVNGQPSNIMRYMVDRYCVVAATAGAVNVIPNFDAVDTALGPVMRLALERGDLYSIVQSIAFVSNLGFVMYLNEGQQLIFQATQGIDRTAQGALYREYSVDGESLVNPGSFDSIEGYKNHARVIGKKTGVDVYAPGVPSSVSGWDRRTMVVDANDIGTAADYVPGPDGDPATTIAQDQADLRERGRQELRAQANRYQRLVTGDIPTANWNATSYGLGDIVWVKDNEGVRSKMRISEQIWSLDKTGQKRTPTFEEYYTE